MASVKIEGGRELEFVPDLALNSSSANIRWGFASRLAETSEIRRPHDAWGCGEVWSGEEFRTRHIWISAPHWSGGRMPSGCSVGFANSMARLENLRDGSPLGFVRSLVAQKGMRRSANGIALPRWPH